MSLFRLAELGEWELVREMLDEGGPDNQEESNPFDLLLWLVRSPGPMTVQRQALIERVLVDAQAEPRDVAELMYYAKNVEVAAYLFQRVLGSDVNWLDFLDEAQTAIEKAPIHSSLRSFMIRHHPFLLTEQHVSDGQWIRFLVFVLQNEGDYLFVLGRLQSKPEYQSVLDFLFILMFQSIRSTEPYYLHALSDLIRLGADIHYHGDMVLLEARPDQLRFLLATNRFPVEKLRAMVSNLNPERSQIIQEYLRQRAAYQDPLVQYVHGQARTMTAADEVRRQRVVPSRNVLDLPEPEFARIMGFLLGTSESEAAPDRFSVRSATFQGTRASRQTKK